MNPGLVVCLFGSVAVALMAGATVVVAGWGVVAGLLAYSASGSTALLAMSLALRERVPELAQPALA